MENDRNKMYRLGTTLAFGARRRGSSHQRTAHSPPHIFADPRKLSVFTKGSGGDILTSDSTI